MNWLGHILGLDNLSGAWYGFWSGFAGDISQIAILGGLYSMWRKHNCHVKGCPRVGRHKVAGTEWVVCRRHHPDDAPTAADIAEQSLKDGEPA